MGLVIDVVALIVLALTYPEAVMLLEVVLVKKPIGLVTDVTTLIVLALTNPEADMLLAVRFVNDPIGEVIEVVPLISLALICPLEVIPPSTLNAKVPTPEPTLREQLSCGVVPMLTP